MESEDTKQESSATGMVMAGSFWLFVVAPIVALCLGTLLTKIIPGCNTGEDGAWGCIVLGLSLNWPVFWLTIGGFVWLVAGIPTFIGIAVLCAIAAAMAEKSSSKT